MNTPQPPSGTPEPGERLPAFRFSLRSLLWLMTGVALYLGMHTVLPGFLLSLVVLLFWLAALGILITGVFFARGDQRAFCIGAATATTSYATIWSSFMYSPFSGPWAFLMPPILVGIAAANGWLCVRARRYFERSS